MRQKLESISNNIDGHGNLCFCGNCETLDWPQWNINILLLLFITKQNVFLECIYFIKNSCAMFSNPELKMIRYI